MRGEEPGTKGGGSGVPLQKPTFIVDCWEMFDVWMRKSEPWAKILKLFIHERIF